MYVFLIKYWRSPQCHEAWDTTRLQYQHLTETTLFPEPKFKFNHMRDSGCVCPDEALEATVVSEYSKGDRQQQGCHSLSIYDCILKRARCLEMKGTLSAGGPHRPPWSPQSGWLRLAFSLKAAPINCEGDPDGESCISPTQMWPHCKLEVPLRSSDCPTPPQFHLHDSLFLLCIKSP